MILAKADSMMKRSLGVLMLLSLAFISYSQTFKFSGTVEAFPEDLETLYKGAADKKAAKEFVEMVTDFWINPETPAELKELILSTCTQLAAKRARPYPHYETYLTTMMIFHQHGHTGDSFDNWTAAVTKLLKTPRFALRHLNSFLKISRDLIATNTVYSTPAVKWVSRSDNYRYEFEDEKLSIVFGPTELICHSKNDSISIFDTQGVFYPLEKQWYGEQGRVTWERSGFEPNMVYCTFDQYQISMDKAKFALDSVEFYNRHYFDFPLKGSLQHKVMVVQSPEGAIYPKFTSSNQRFEIEDIHPNINYEGGFAQTGAKFLGAGTHDNPAVITIFRKDTLFVTAKSLYFALRKDQILSNDTEVKISLDTAFVYHPGLIFKYMAEQNAMYLIRNGEGLALSPYFNTFHNVSMDVELIRWDLDEIHMDLRMLTGAAQNQAFFESLSYFREAFYNKLQGMDAIHPLQGLKDCSKYFNRKPFSVRDYSRFMHLPEGQVRQQVIGLSFYGFVGYNVNTDEIQVRQRLFDYLDFRLGKKDFDVIRFNSLTPGQQPNAQLDLKNYDLNLNGVESISICDHQNVVFFPRDKQIILKENRNFVFHGIINAGMLNLFGNGFKFSYDDFRIDMSNIDSLRMKVLSEEMDYFGRPLLKTVNNTIAQLSGHLQIDEPDNKSGAKTNSQFPIIVSDIESYVYFDRSDIQGGAYDRENFFFTLDPFEMDSINTLRPDNFNFAGEFESHIFPTFRENLTIRPSDYSLGFRRETPPEGYPLFDGGATFTNTIDLSNNGLKGNGVLAYVTSSSHSENFTFLPDMVKGQAHDFTVQRQVEGVEFPDVRGKYTYVEYLPEQDYLMSRSQEENFVMYKEEAQMEGELKVTPAGLTGKGSFYMLRASLVSPAMTFGEHIVDADLSDFSLAAGEVEGVSFSTTNLVSHIDFVDRQGTFHSKSGGSPVEFTDNRYMSYIADFSWHMDKNEIYLGARGSKGNRFVSTHRRQDSLAFLVPMARYDVESKTIFAEEVKQIEVGDVDMLLGDGFVTIREDAAMDALDSVRIVIKDSVAAHTIYDSHVQINGKYAYSAYGKYDYLNGAGKTLTLDFHKIELNKENQTEANGKITEQELFTFDKHFAFKGDVNLKAGQEHLFFDGGAQMLHRCSGRLQSYLRFTSQIDPGKVMIPVGEEAENFEFNRIYKDFFITKDSTHVYSSFLEDRKDYSDIPMITGEGFLVYNEKNKSFDIASAQKINYPDSTGNVVRFSESDCNIMAEGVFDLGVSLDQVKTRASGTLIHQRDKNEILGTAMLGIDFFFNEAALDAMYSAFMSAEAKSSKLSAATFEKRMAEWSGFKIAKKVEKDRSTMGIAEAMPLDLQQMLLFSNVDFKWNTKKRAYIIDGKADLAFIKQFAVNKEVNVKAEIVRKRSGNSIDMFIELDKDNWFYFSYKSGMMQTLSSDGQYNTIVQGLKADERKQKVGLGEKSFSFIMAPESKKKRFLTNFNKSNAPEEDEVEEADESNDAIEEEQ